MFGGNYFGKVYPAQNYYPTSRNFSQLLTLTVSVTSSFLKGVGKGMASTVSVTTGSLKGVGKFLSQTVTVDTQFGKALLQALGVVVSANTVSLKQVGKGLATTVTTALLFSLTVNFLLNASVTVYLDLTAATSLKVALMVVTTAVTVVFQKQIGRFLALVVSASIQLTKGLLASLATVFQVSASRILGAHKTLESQGNITASDQNQVGVLRAVQVVTGSNFGKQVAKGLNRVVQIFLDMGFRVSGIPLISGIAYIGDKLFHRIHTGDKGE